MIEGWLRAAEQIAHFAAMNGASVLGFLSIDGDAGVTTISRMVCEVFSRSKTQALLVDLASPIPDATAPTEASDKDIIWSRMLADTHGCSAMVARPTAGTRYLFNNVSLLQQTWKAELASHSILVLDLPPVLQELNHLVNPLAAAVSCDAVFLVCLQGRTTRARLAEAAAVLHSARVNVSRLVINQRDYSTPAEEIARSARQFSKIAPGFAAWIESKALNSEFLGWHRR